MPVRQGSITLAPLQEDDLPRLLAAIPSAEALVQWSGPSAFRHPLDLDQLRGYLAEAGSGPQSRWLWKALDDSGEAVGLIELGMVNPDNGTASLCRVLVFPEHRRRGVCTPMVRAALRSGFEEIGLRRIDLRVYAHNQAAIRCYERAGFVREGLLRRGQRVGERVWDVVLMGILREEWSLPEADRPEGQRE